LNWLERIGRWRKQKLLRHSRIPHGLWDRIVGDAIERYQLDPHELQQLRELSSVFLQRKVFSGAGGLELDDYMRAIIASEACLLVLHLDLDYYDGWVEIIVYPDSFVVTRDVQDDIGVVHTQRSVLGGEAWSRGPVILAWEDVRPGAQPHGPGSNVILHEFAHKLDMLDGAANGVPPLHKDMDPESWKQTLTLAYNDLQRQVIRHHRTRIDPYGAENPAEFFAVVTEEFFESPVRLHGWYPELYAQLSMFYRQDPLRRMSSTGRDRHGPGALGKE
jgi:MtfA peptidase